MARMALDEGAEMSGRDRTTVFLGRECFRLHLHHWSFSAHSISRWPRAIAQPPKLINFRPVKIAIDFTKARGNGGGLLLGDE